MKIEDNLRKIKSELPDNVELVAVSKTMPNEYIQQAYDAGQRIFGENKVQELCKKAEELPKDIQWHYIGHLQTNKVKYIAPFVSLIHGVDSLKLLKTINKEAKKNKRIINCLLQFHIAEEETKFGLSLEEAKDLISNDEFPRLKNINLAGVMGMATYTDNRQQVREEFDNLTRFFHLLKKYYFKENNTFKEISMGMSGDYPIAVEAGSTLVRIGSLIFGARNYAQ